MLIFVFDWTMYVIIMVVLCRYWQRRQKRDVRTYRKLFRSAVMLSVVFGLGWGFGIAASSPAEDSNDAEKVVSLILQTIFTIFVACQGILIFLFYGVLAKKAREVWKRWFCVKFIARMNVASMELHTTRKTDQSSTDTTTIPRDSSTLQRLDTYALESAAAEEDKMDLSKQEELSEEAQQEPTELRETKRRTSRQGWHARLDLHTVSTFSNTSHSTN